MFTADVCVPCAHIIESSNLDEHDRTPAARENISAFLKTVPFHTITGFGVEDGRGHWQECDCCKETVLDTVPVTGLP